MAVKGLGIGFDEIFRGALDFLDNFPFPLGGLFEIIQVHVGHFHARIHPLRLIRFEQFHGSPQGLDRGELLLHFQLGQGQPIIGLAKLLVLL